MIEKQDFQSYANPHNFIYPIDSNICTGTPEPRKKGVSYIQNFLVPRTHVYSRVILVSRANSNKITSQLTMSSNQCTQ